MVRKKPRKPGWRQGIYTPKNEAKYSGKRPINFKSQWEHTFMMFCDNNPSMISWAYESVRIPYFNPVKQKQSIYVPDFLIFYKDKFGKEHMEMIEIKPKEQFILTEKSSLKERIEITVNNAKFREAIKWCKHRNILFRLLPKEDIYRK